jgi:hypothetical protein
MRLVGTFAPLLGGNNDLPSDAFEQAALQLALQGQASTSVERVDNRWYLRRAIALSNTFHQNCVLCHTNFTAEFFTRTHNPGEWVGALMPECRSKTNEARRIIGGPREPRPRETSSLRIHLADCGSAAVPGAIRPRSRSGQTSAQPAAPASAAATTTRMTTRTMSTRSLSRISTENT